MLWRAFGTGIFTAVVSLFEYVSSDNFSLPEKKQDKNNFRHNFTKVQKKSQSKDSLFNIVFTTTAQKNKQSLFDQKIHLDVIWTCVTWQKE